MIRIREAIIVEGRYDKNTLAQIVDAPILETSGFGIFHDGQRLALLRRLAETPGQAVSRVDLTVDLGRTPSEEADNSDRAIDVQITRLRRKIEPDPKEPRYLQTVRGAGYMLMPD